MKPGGISHPVGIQMAPIAGPLLWTHICPEHSYGTVQTPCNLMHLFLLKNLRRFHQENFIRESSSKHSLTFIRLRAEGTSRIDGKRIRFFTVGFKSPVLWAVCWRWIIPWVLGWWHEVSRWLLKKSTVNPLWAPPVTVRRSTSRTKGLCWWLVRAQRPYKQQLTKYGCKTTEKTGVTAFDPYDPNKNFISGGYFSHNQCVTVCMVVYERKGIN